MSRSLSTRRCRLLGAVLFLLAAGSACSEPTTATHSLVMAHARWLNTAPAVYEFTFQRSCFCIVESLRPVVIRVENGHVASVRYSDTGAAVADADKAGYPTIDSLFETIARAVNRPADSIQAEYDPTYGFPTSVFIDYSVQTADDEGGFVVSAFHAL